MLLLRMRGLFRNMLSVRGVSVMAVSFPFPSPFPLPSPLNTPS